MKRDESLEERWSELVRVANSILRDRSAAEDAVQDLFLGLIPGGAERIMEAPRAYLRQAVRNAARNLVRRERREHLKRIASALGLADSGRSDEDVGEEVRKALDILPIDERSAVMRK